MITWRERFPAWLGAAVVLSILGSSFIPWRALGVLRDGILDLTIILAAFVWIPAALEVVAQRGQRWRAGDAQARADTLAQALGFCSVLGAVAIDGLRGEASQWLYAFVFVVLSAAVQGLVGFYVLSALARAAQRGRWEALLFVASAVLVLVSRWPGAGEGDVLAMLGRWWMTVPVAAGQRAVVLGTAAATVLLALRWLGGGARILGGRS